METIKRRQGGFSLKATGAIMGVVAFVISVFLIVSLSLVSNKFYSMHQSMENYMGWKDSADDVQKSSDYLTGEIRSFVATERAASFDDERAARHLENYFNEVKSLRRQKAIEDIEKRLPNSEVLEKLKTAVNQSVTLENEEYAAMHTIVDVRDGTALTDILEQKDYWSTIVDFDMSKSAYIVNHSVDYATLTNEQKIELAAQLVFGDVYEGQKKTIIDNVNGSLQELDAMMKKSVHGTAMSLERILIIQQILIALNVVFLVGIVLLSFIYIVRPIRRAVGNLENGENVDIRRGAREYRYLAETYNHIHEQNLLNQEKLAYEAEHDKLTGLYNRTGYDKVYSRTELDKSAYILIDVDKFKAINDKNGHAVGDNVLVNVGEAISKHFHEDNASVFRLGGDEFSIIVEGVKLEDSNDLVERCRQINAELNNGKNNTPNVSLSIGIAFGEKGDTTDTLFRKADIALYNTKKNGRADVCVYHEILKTLKES